MNYFWYGVLTTLGIQIALGIIWISLAIKNAPVVKSDDELMDEYITNSHVEALEQQKMYNLKLQATIEQLEADLETSHILYDALEKKIEKFYVLKPEYTILKKGESDE